MLDLLLHAGDLAREDGGPVIVNDYIVIEIGRGSEEKATPVLL